MYQQHELKRQLHESSNQLHRFGQIDLSFVHNNNAKCKKQVTIEGILYLKINTKIITESINICNKTLEIDILMDRTSSSHFI